MEVVPSSFSSGLCVPPGERVSYNMSINQAEAVCTCTGVFLRQNANGIQTPPKDDEAKYLQDVHLDNASCHFVVQKDKETMFLPS